MRAFVDARTAAIVISPAAVAVAVLRQYAPAALEPHIEYASLEHLKHMARRVLARRFDDDGAENRTYNAQAEMFSGYLQDRYPLPRTADEEPTYKLRGLLTAEERAWNVALLRKSATARLEHADALEAEGISKPEAA